MNEPSSKEVSILLVEDDDVEVMSMNRSLRELNFSNPVTRVVDGIEALTLLRSGSIARPFTILLDLNLPRMSGLEFLQALREDDVLKDAIVFVLTTSKSDEDIRAAYRYNIAGYFVKSTLNHDFNQVLSFLDHYWKLVVMPS